MEHAADRAPFICQSQSVNIFLPANVHKRDLHQIHMMAWKICSCIYEQISVIVKAMTECTSKANILLVKQWT